MLFTTRKKHTSDLRDINKQSRRDKMSQEYQQHPAFRHGWWVSPLSALWDGLWTDKCVCPGVIGVADLPRGSGAGDKKGVFFFLSTNAPVQCVTARQQCRGKRKQEEMDLQPLWWGQEGALQPSDNTLIANSADWLYS